MPATFFQCLFGSDIVVFKYADIKADANLMHETMFQNFKSSQQDLTIDSFRYIYIYIWIDFLN